MDAMIVIPARWGSSRFPGKPLELINGRTLIEHTWRRAKSTGMGVVIATDDERIRKVAHDFGAAVSMTGEARNGTERCAMVAHEWRWQCNVVNWQGDSPLVPPSWIKLLVSMLERVDVATPVQRCTQAQIDRLRHAYLAGTPSGTLAVLDYEFRALYFSKAPIPVRGPWWLHVGIYAMTAEALARYGSEESMLEKSEQLEQLRFLEQGREILAVPVDGPPIWEVNVPDDIRVVEELMNGTVRA